MKKLSKILAVAFALLLSIPLIGCGSASTGEIRWNDNTQERVFLADFEEGNDNLNLLRISRSFGKITRNTDAEYVHSGVGSAKIQPLGGVIYYSKPMMYLMTKSNRFGFDYGDFSKVDYVSMWIYNSAKEEQTLKVGLVTKILSFEKIEYTVGDSFKLPAGEWTEVNYFVDFNTMNIAGEIAEYTTTMIQGIYLEFSNAGSMEIEDAPVLYLDDVSIGYREEAFQFKDPIELDKNEICNFEKLYQKYVFIGETTGSAACLPDLEVVKPEAEGVMATSGAYALKAVLNAGTADGGSWPNIVLPEKVMQKSMLTKISKEEYANYSFCLDLYNASATDMELYFKFYSKNKQHRSTYKITCPAGEWVTFKKTLAEIGSGVTQSSPETYVDGLRVSDPGVFEISWREFGAEEGNKTFFFDNFRLVKEA